MGLMWYNELQLLNSIWQNTISLMMWKIVSEKKSVKKKKEKSLTRKKWTPAEEEEIKKRFASFLARDKCPGQKDVEKVMAQSKKCGGLLHARPRDNIKKKVSCMLVKARRRNKDVEWHFNSCNDIISCKENSYTSHDIVLESCTE